MFYRYLLSATAILFVLSACQPAASPPTNTAVPASPTSPPSPTPDFLTPIGKPKESKIGKTYFDVHYCTDGDMPLRMNITLPITPLREPTPVVVHTRIMSNFIPPLAERGFIVASIDWREPPDYKLPIGVEDVKCGIRYLRAHADFYHLDPDHIGAFGCSRGGHTAALVGVTDQSANMEGDFGFSEQSSRVQAVVMFDGIADFKTNYADAPSELEEVHGITSFDDPLVALLSPITHVTKDDPPFLLIASEITGFQMQAEQMAEALKVQGVPYTYIQAKGALHCEFSNSGPNSLDEMEKIVGDFFEQMLK